MKRKILSLLAIFMFVAAIAGCNKTVKYSVSFNSNGGSEVANISAKKDSLIEEPTKPTKAGYKFIGWYKDEALTEAWKFDADKLTGDIILYAKYEILPSLETDNSGHVDLQSSTTILSKINSGANMLLYFGDADCGTCARFKTPLNGFVEQYHIKIYYLENQENPVYTEDMKTVLRMVGTIEQNGRLLPTYPQLFAFVNGQLKGITGSGPDVAFIYNFASAYFNIPRA